MSARATRARMLAVVGVLAALLAATLVAAAAVGSVAIDLRRALSSAPDGVDAVILFRTRLPRVLLGAAVGGGLASAGAALQALLRNPLASPDVIGVSGGASLGAIAVLAFSGAGAGSGAAITAAAFLGALGSILLIVRLASVHGRLNPYALLLVGVVVNTVAAALIMLVGAMLESSQAQGVLLWLTGSLSIRSAPVVAAVWAYAVGATIVLWLQARSLNLFSIGEEGAAQLGTDVAAVRRTTFLASAFLVGAAVSVSGVIGFVGLIVPHCLRLVLGPDHRILIPASFLGGAIFLVWADAAARTLLAPTEVPVGVVTALCGGPFFVFLLRREQRLGAP